MPEQASGVPVRRMQLSDLPVVMVIDAASLPRPWSRAVWREELESPFGLYLVLEEAGQVWAQIGVKLVGEELHVMTLAVSPERRRRGYARALVEAAVSAHPEAAKVYLEVRPGNTAARELYESLGFEVTGVRPRYYGDEDALLMTLDLQGRR
ncbi:MAG: ribosomal protein S18-alanine N-acetyltransferase [Actinomycetota bacterium]|nr:ribosomal protein S18-alanine N-acetyltransferase [Actinomycetota bacterium]HZY65155.1 ribosomal protein S18-alanine N-acetyltransferase [Rubrobacteraceae bacterium]